MKKKANKIDIFILEYLKDSNATRAAKVAGYSNKTAYSQGCRLLKKAEVMQAIEKRKADLAKEVKITREWVLECLRRNAVQCINPGDTYNPAAGNKALELLGKELKMFIDRRLLGVRNVDDMSEEELLEFIGGEPSPEELAQAAGDSTAGES